MLQLALTILLVLHLAWHVIAGLGITYSLVHSDRVHKHRPWKLVMAVVWLMVSILLIVAEVADHHTCH